MEPTVAIESGADSTPVVHPIIDAYHQQLLSGPLVEAPLRASSAAVVSTFSSLVEAHKSEVEVLQLDNTHLRQQLEKCAQVIESLSTKLQEQQQTLSVAEAKPKLASDVLSASPEQEATQTESTTTADTFGTVPGCSGSSLEVSALTAVAPTAAAQCSPEAVAALLTEVASARSYVRQADVVQQQWMQSASSLSTLIGNLTRENASFRKEVELLKSSTVDRELHQKVLVELDAARQQLETMVLEGEQMAIEFDHKSQQQNDVVVQLRSDLERMSARAEATHPSQSEGHSGPTPHHHGELWQVAMRELEEQAIVAASAQDTKAKLHEVEAALSKSLQHTEDLRTELNSITADNERLRSDAQNLTFRNSVLSQQLSSLLVKCEKLARIVRGNNADIDSQVSTTSVQPLDHPRANSSALFLATEATRLLSRRSSASVQQRPTSSYPLATTDITLTPGEARHAPSRSRLSNSYACLSTRRLDVVALDESGIAPSEAQRLQTTPALEVERGLQRSLGTFHNARRRSVAMRNFGSAELSVALPTEARLPASDQLSGVSLGRPSSFSILDPQQRTLYQSPHQPPLNATDKLGNSTSASPTSDSAMEWLELLDQIDANEDIDRYSVNSVSELVVRNQELLQQLYSATQSSSPLAAVASSSNDHVEEAARPRASLSGQKRPRSPSNNSAEVKDKDKHTAPFTPTPLPTISPLLPSGSAGETLTTASFATVPSGNNPQLQSSVDDMSADAQGIAQKLFQAVLDRQAAQQHVSQENIITLLLSVMEAQQQFHQQVEKGVDGGASTRDVLSGSLIGSLVNLCCSQAMKLANQSTSEAERITQLQHPWWEAARGMVEELVREVTALLTSAAPTTAVVETATSSDSKATSNAEGEMLRHLLHLLQHASLKEGTLLQVFQVALKRQGSYMALIQRRERKKRRLATASTSPPPVVPTSLQPVHDTNEEAADTQPEQNLTLSARLRPVAPPGRLSPYGSPVVVHATADEFPASSMPQTEILPPIASSYALDGGSSDEDDVDDVWLCNNDDHSGRLDELREQLALLSAKFHAQTNELNEERSQHVKLLEQMWKLEAEREDAMAVLDASEQKMASMMTREEYESVVSELDRGRSTISDLEGQLEFAHRQKMATQAENEALAKELDGHQKRFEEKSIDLRRDLQQATDALESEHARYRRLQHDLSDAKMEIDAVRRNAHIVQEDLLASKESNHGLQQEVDELKVALLSADSSQELLRRLYPGDTALSANADLIQRMQAKIQRLENELSMIRKESERLTQSITSKDHQLRQEVQRRQSAEAHLQSSLEQLTSSQVAWRSAPMEGSTALESTEQDMPTPHVVRDLMRTVEQLETSVAGYRSEIHVLRESEAAWKKREEELRAEVQLLSRNPISDCARRYGLQDTTSFEKQLEELDARCQALQTKQIDCEAALASAQKKLEVSEDALQRSEQDLKELESQLRAANDECQELTNSVESQAQSIRTLEAEKVEVANALATSEEAGRVAQEHLHSVEAAKSKLQEDYRKCEEDRRTIFTNMNAVMDKVKDLERDLQRSDAEKRAANEALAQGISTVSRRHQAPPPRYGGTSLSLTSAFGSATPSSQSPSPNTSTR